MKTERFSITHTLPVSPALVSCWASCCLYQQTHTEQIQTSLSTSSRLCSCNKLFINLTRVKVLSLTVTLSKVLADSNDLQVSCLLTHRIRKWRGQKAAAASTAPPGGEEERDLAPAVRIRSRKRNWLKQILWYCGTLTHSTVVWKSFSLFTLHSGC